ncbi:MAG TPA: MFS transporter [Gaiellaceae bacterium]|nr:MFS transporter [Gaiellaceae bacterium]
MKRFLLLRTAPDYRRLFLATLTSGVGTYLAAIALTVDVYDRTGSGKWVSALLVAEFLPMVLVGLLLGPLVDRLSRRRLMIASDLVRIVVFCLLPFAGSPGVVVALALVAGFATGFFRPAVYAGLPNLVDDEELPAANSLLQAVENLTWMVGPVVGGLLLAVRGPDLAYWVNAVTFLLSALLLVRIPAARLRAGLTESRGHWQDVGDGVRAVIGSRALVLVLVVWNVVLLGVAAVNVSEVVLAKVSLDAGDVGFGILVGATGLGLTLGSLAAATLLDRLGVRLAYAGGILLMASGFGVAAIAPSLPVAVAGVVVGAFGNGAAVVCNALLVQRGASDEVRGRAFTVIMSSNYILLGLGMVVAGPLVDAFGARWLWGGASVLFLLAAATAVVLARNLHVEVEEAHVEPALASRV